MPARPFPSPKQYAAGCVYFVNDDELMLPAAERQHHLERRPVVVVSDQNAVHGTNAEPSTAWPSVIVVPISSSTSYKTRFDVRIPAGEANLTKKGWARIPAMQMLDKDFLGDMTGQVEHATLEKMTSQILNYLGLINPEEEEQGQEPF